jgi:Protein of unknown function (DUF3567)
MDKDKTSMQMLYDSDSFVVVQIHANAPEESAPVPAAPQLARNGFEIVDKRSGKEVYLDGSWAELFQQRVTAWQQNAPTQEEIEDTLEGYAELAHTPIALH